ncbi:X-linked retinitis pigmentosa GTPase regulator-like isoform X2 [Epinephelus moara]|uniref:X-linked retinitis pigmentosa GTPase regulator-like isoform X2 n=1 Tax=Epinephelus moara TaxID=300413 RepID=UPI00214EC229|nr:X-linked retinitis pigmentosa GTPase regulator-like isoform X2 [Epinephelus moara]
MAGESEDEIPESGAVFTFGKSKFADNVPSKFWLKNDVPSKIACGDEHTALITENGKLFMFGSNNWGQLGLGSKVTVNKPTCVKALKSEKVEFVACGRNHTLISTAQGKVFASGGNSEGQLGLGDCEERTAFQRVAFFDSRGPIKMLAAGSNTSAALTESGKLFMWGDNTEGQIGLGKESHASSPQEVSVGQPISWVSCGYYHSAFVTVDGALYTFGECDSGKLGLGTDQLPRHRVPQLVKSVKEPVVQVACGGGHTVALTEDDVFTFGLGQFGQLGHGTFIFESRLPRPVEHFKRGRVCQVTCGENHTAVITDGGLLYTFGDGRHGKLGLGEENFTNQFKPTLCPRFLKYNVQAAPCGGCHMVVLARPRDPSCTDVILEEDDVTEDYLEKPYVELLGDTTDSSTLQRSLSARVRRRERERSPDQFGTMFHTLPAMTPGYLHPPLPVSSHTIPPRLPPPELTHRKTGGETDSVVESLTDTDSVKGLGETTDFLNMTHVMKMDPGDKTLTLSPVQKRKGKHGKTTKGQRENPVKESKLLKQSSFSSTSPSRGSKAVSPRRPLPTELLRSPGARSLAPQSPHRLRTTNKENLTMEELQRKPSKNKPSVGDIRKAASKQRLRPAQGKSQLIEVGRKLESKQSPETRKMVVSGAEKVKPSKPKSKPIAVRSAGASSPRSPGFHLGDALDDESSGRRLSEVRKKSKDADFSKKSKNEKNKKEAESNKETSSKLGLLAGAASLAAGSVLVHEVASRSRLSSPSLSESSHSARKDSTTKSRSEESESGAADVSNKSAVSINIIPDSSEGRTSQDEKDTSQDEEDTSQDEKGRSQDEKDTSEDEKDTSQDEKDTNQDEEDTSQDEKGRSQDEKDTSQDEKDTVEDDKDTSQDEKGTSQDESEEESKDSTTVKQEEEEDEDEEEQRTSADVSEEEEEEDVSHIKKVTEEEDEDDEDSSTLQPEDESESEAGEEASGDEEEDSAEEEEEEEEEEASATAGSESEDETESKESKGGDAGEEEEEEEESEEGSSQETESKGGESEHDEEEEGEEEEEGDLEKEGEEEEEGEGESAKSSEEEEESEVESETEGGEEEEEAEEGEESSAAEEEEEAEESENEEEAEEESENEEEEEEAEEEEEESAEEKESEKEVVEEEEEEEDQDSEVEEEEADEDEEEEADEDEEEAEEEEEGEEGEEEEEEEGEDEEEDVVKKKKSAEVRSIKSRGKQRSGVKGQAADESEEFWDDVLPQYLNLK